MKQIAIDEQNGNEIRRILIAATEETVTRTGWNGEPYTYDEWEMTNELLIGLKRNQVRLRFPHRKAKVRRLQNPTTDFLSMTALMIADLINPSIWADAIDDNYSDHQDITAFVRDWERIKQENQQ